MRIALPRARIAALTLLRMGPVSAGFDIVVAVASGRDPVPDCIRALEREAGDGMRVVSDEFAWQARRQALATSPADVIAFVDPDVVVPDGWLDALRAAWEASPHSIGAIGGPIRSEVPEWAYGRLGVIDLGEEPLELDPAERSLFGGNLSFWRRALIGVGGFDPPVDGRDATDWLSEEHEAQRQLGHWGWLIRYDPALRAIRLVDDRRELGRAYRYGVRTGIAGGREPAAAAKQAARSGAGAVASFIRGRRADGLEKGSRAAENLGVLAGSRAKNRSNKGGVSPLSHPSVRGQTPQRGSGFSVDAVLLYHRFASGSADPLGLCVSPSNFEAQLGVLAAEFEVVPMGSIAASVRGGEAGSGRIAITIDDGYVDNLTAGIPLLAAAGLPATLFAATGHIDTGRRFFWDEMQRLITGPGTRPDVLRIDGREWPTATAEQRETARRELHALTQPRDADAIEATLDALRDWARGADAADRSGAGGGADGPSEATRPMTVAELRRIAAETPGLEIGAHTRDHVNLGHQTADEIRAQVERSRDDVADWIGGRPVGFSYPFGIPRHDVGDEARTAVADAGFEYAVVNQPVPVEPGADIFAIPRVFAPDVGPDDFRSWLERLLN